MHQPRLVKAHFMLGRMDVDIHLVRIDLKIEHKSGLLIGPELIFAGLANGMVNQAVAHHAAIHIAILNIGKRSGVALRIGDPATQG